MDEDVGVIDPEPIVPEVVSASASPQKDNVDDAPLVPYLSFHAKPIALATADAALAPDTEVAAPESVIDAVTDLPPIVYVNVSQVVTSEVTPFVLSPPLNAAIPASV